VPYYGSHRVPIVSESSLQLAQTRALFIVISFWLKALFGWSGCFPMVDRSSVESAVFVDMDVPVSDVSLRSQFVIGDVVGSCFVTGVNGEFNLFNWIGDWHNSTVDSSKLVGFRNWGMFVEFSTFLWKNKAEEPVNLNSPRFLFLKIFLTKSVFFKTSFSKPFLKPVLKPLFQNPFFETLLYRGFFFETFWNLPFFSTPFSEPHFFSRNFSFSILLFRYFFFETSFLRLFFDLFF
jgi:hypothetical protein